MRWLILGVALSAAATPALAAEFMLNSTQVKSGRPMDPAQVYTACKGQNISPALLWSGEPTGTQSFAVTIYEAKPRAGGRATRAAAGTCRRRRIAARTGPYELPQNSLTSILDYSWVALSHARERARQTAGRRCGASRRMPLFPVDIIVS